MIAGAPESRRREWLSGLALVAAVIVVYAPVWWAGYIWDDDIMLTDNPCVVGPRGLVEIWTTSAADICPLTLTTFWLEHALWGLAPLPYHLVNVLMQGGCAVLLWRVLKTLRIPGAWLGAALWALHPVQVESVAWIAEMKNTESGLFYLLSVLFFVRGLGEKADWNYGASLLFAAMAMMSKSSTVILPLVLLLCSWWREGHWQWRNLARVGPIFLMSIIGGGVSIWTQSILGAADLQGTQSWPERLVTAGDAVWFYFGKLIWPHPLMAVYPRWQVDAAQGLSYLPMAGMLIVSGLLWFYRGSWARPWLFAWSYFLCALLPVLGFARMNFQGQSFVADHLQYLAGMGPLALVAAGITRARETILLKISWLPSLLAAGVLIAVGCTSCLRAWVYEDEGTLWTDTLSKNPASWVGHNNLGNFLVKNGQLDEAIAHFQTALELNPAGALTYNDLGLALADKGDATAAMIEYRKALAINPDLPQAHGNIGNFLAQKGQLDAAMAEYRKALEKDPAEAIAYNNMGNILFQKGEIDAAIAQFQKALEIDPGNAAIHFNFGNALLQKGEPGRAMTQFQEALRLQPGLTVAQDKLAQAQAMAARKGSGP